MEYSSQLLNDNYYINICNYFLSIASEDIKPKLQELLYEGHVGDFILGSDISHKNNPNIEMQRRISMAYLLINTPETFEYFKNNKINIFHGTNANALASISQYGLCSVDYLSSNSIKINTGEKWSRIQGKRNFVSFADVLEIAENYSSIYDKKNRLSFPVIICTTTEELKKRKIVPVSSDISEIAIAGELPLDSIKCICVPKDKIKFAKRIINNDKIMVLPISRVDSKFYYVDEIGVQIIPDSERNKSKRTSFNEIEVMEMAKKRNLYGIKNVMQKIKAFFNKIQDKYLGVENDEHRFKM